MARPKSDIEPRILHAARKRFLEDGVDGASLRRIARDAETSIGMIYYYFPTKEALFLAVVEQSYVHLLDGLRVALAPDVPVAARLERLYLRIGAATPEELEVMQIVVRELLTSPPRRALLFDRFMRGHVPLILQTVLDGVARGELTSRQPPPVVALSIAATAIFPQVIRHLVGDRIPAALAIPSGEALSRALADIILGGVGTVFGNSGIGEKS